MAHFTFFLFMRTSSFVAKLPITKFDVVTYVGKRNGVYLVVSHASYPRRTAAFHFASPPSCTYSLTYCLQPLTQNGEIRHSNAYWEVNVFKSV